MFKKTTALTMTVFLILALISAAAASETGLFGILSRSEGADERLAFLEEIAEQVSASQTSDRFSVEVSQAYYEGNRIYISYKASGGRIEIHDGLELGDGSYADIIFGDVTEQEDGSVIGWKECIIPEGMATDTQTFHLVFGEDYKNRISFTLNRKEYDQYLQGESQAESCRAQAELAMGKVDLKGTVRLISPEQAASWRSWQEGEEGTGTDVIACWNLYQNGEPVSFDLFGAIIADDTDEIIFEVMFPRMDDLSGLSLVPEYSEGGEKPEEAILLEPVNRE